VAVPKFHLETTLGERALLPIPEASHKGGNK
jgi:hypothetical protein